VHRGTVLLKYKELAWEVEMLRMAGRNCCNSIILGLILFSFTNLDSVMDKCQTGVMSTTCDSPADVTNDLTLIVCAGVSSWRLSSWWVCVHSVILLFFRYNHCKLFLSVNETLLTLLGEYFWATVLNGWVWLHSAVDHCDFWAQTSRDYSSDVSEVWWGI